MTLAVGQFSSFCIIKAPASLSYYDTVYFLLFLKGTNAGYPPPQFGASQSKPEFTVDLKGGSVDWASKDKSSKKHVIEVCV